MSDKKFTVKTGDEIVIRVPSGKQPARPSGKKGASRGMLRARRADDFLSRRLKKGFFANFYDFGQIRNEQGAFVEKNFIRFPSATYLEQRADLMILEDFTLADWENVHADLFSVPIDEWKDKYRKLEFETAGDYAVDFKSDANDQILPVAKKNTRPILFTYAENSQSDKFTEKGLKIEKKINNFSINSIGTFHGFDTANSEQIKITEEPSFDAAETPMNLSQNFDVFLVPAVWLNSVAIVVSTLPYEMYLLNAHYSTLPRELFLQKFGQAQNAFVNQGLFLSRNSPEAAQIFDYQKSIPGARAFLLTDENVNTTPRQSVSPDAVPLTGASEATQFRSRRQLFTENDADLEQVQMTVKRPIGSLVAVVQTGEKNYFIWRKAENAAPSNQVDVIFT